MLSSGTAAIMMMYQIADGLMDACGYDKDSEEHRFILLGIYIANIGAYMLPFKGVHLSTLAVATGIMATFNVEFNAGLYLISCCFTVIIFIIIYILMMKYVFKCNLEPLKNFDTEKLQAEGGTKFNTRQAVLLGAFVVGVCYLLVQIFLPATNPFMVFAKKVGSAWLWVVIFCILAIPHTKDGKSFINAGACLRDNAMWGTVAMIGCISMCGMAISKPDLGIQAWLLEICKPILGNMSFLSMVIVSVVGCTVLTQFLNGSPIAYVLNTLLIPFACQLELAGKGNATTICSVVTFCCFFAFVTPAASSTAPLITGHKNMTSKFLWTKGWIYTAVWIVVAIVVFYVFGLII